MTFRRSFALIFSVLLILSMSFMSRSYAAHITEHTHHHTPATHSTGICSWMCAAAQTMSNDIPLISQPIQSTPFMEWTLPEFPALIFPTFLPARAPPR